MYLSARTPEIPSALVELSITTSTVIAFSSEQSSLPLRPPGIGKILKAKIWNKKTEILVGGVPWRTGELPTPVTWPVLGLITSHFKANLLREELVTL